MAGGWVARPRVHAFTGGRVSFPSTKPASAAQESIEYLGAHHDPSFDLISLELVARGLRQAGQSQRAAAVLFHAARLSTCPLDRQMPLAQSCLELLVQGPPAVDFQLLYMLHKARWGLSAASSIGLHTKGGGRALMSTISVHLGRWTWRVDLGRPPGDPGPHWPGIQA